MIHLFASILGQIDGLTPPSGSFRLRYSRKRFRLSSRNGELSEKAGSESRGDGFLGLGKSGWKPLAVSRRKYWAGSAQLKANGFILTSRRAKKTNSGLTEDSCFMVSTKANSGPKEGFVKINGSLTIYFLFSDHRPAAERTPSRSPSNE